MTKNTSKPVGAYQDAHKPLYFRVSGNLFGVLTFCFVAYLIMISSASSLDAGWLRQWLSSCEALVELERKVLPVFDAVASDLIASSSSHRIAIVHHVIAVSWVAIAAITCCFATLRAAMLFDSSVNPNSISAIDSLSRKAAYLHFGTWTLLAIGAAATYGFGWLLSTNDPRLAFQYSNYSLFILGVFALSFPLSFVSSISTAIEIFRRERNGWLSAPSSASRMLRSGRR